MGVSNNQVREFITEQATDWSVGNRTGLTEQERADLLAWAVQRGTALITTPTSAGHARESFSVTPLPQEAFEAISRTETRHRLKDVVTTGIPGFIPRGR